MDKIIIKGAKENNLKNIDLEIPRNKFVVLTGVSGSGKSSLAFDTIFAEGQRRYMESLSSYARQFLGQMEKPNVDFIEGLSPTISIDQKTTNHNPRSTVGTVTEIYDYLRLLYARIGVPHCPKCGLEIRKKTIDEIVDQLLSLKEGTKIQLLAPIVRNRKGEHKKILLNMIKNGFVRVRIDKIIYDLNEDIEIEKNKKHNIEVVVDRLVIKQEIRKRLYESIEIAMNLSEGILSVDTDLYEEELLFSQNFSCIDCGISIQEIEPSLFSFNNPSGACPDCMGLGIKMKFDKDLIIPDDNLSLIDGAIKAPGFNVSNFNNNLFKALSEKFNFKLDTPYKDLKEDVKNIILYGLKEDTIPIKYLNNGEIRSYNYNFDGIINILNRRYRETTSESLKQEYENYMVNSKCNTCKGKRLKEEVLSVKIENKNISDITEMTLEKVKEFFENIKLKESEKIIAEQILIEIKSRLGFLIDVGLDYLTLSRSASTLSGGESQRIRLGTQIGAGLVGVVYILDEPSIGLHQRDNDKLLKTLKYLKDLGNTLLVVEHDTDTMIFSDYIIDIGPFAGKNGGEVVFKGTYKEILKSKNSITGEYLSGRKKIEVPKKRRKIDKNNMIIIKGAKENNLKNINVSIPLGVFTCITGVSGSGKSSLINQVLYKRLLKEVNGSKIKAGDHKDIEGISNIDKVINIDQHPIGKTPRSNPATYTGVFDLIREIFAQTAEAKMRGYKKGRFSFNINGGRCEHCSGDGIIKIEMHFLPDVYVPCEVCKGKRYNRETLEIKYKSKTISDVLNMTVEEGLQFFSNIPKIKEKLQTLFDVGLSYIKLGQSSTTLSGGEAQRIKLATELSKRSTKKTVYILDEPTTGLHTYDVHKLIYILQRLTEAGNTVIVIEHNLDLIKTSDYIIDLGPEGGIRGGKIVAQGTPEEILKFKESYTAKYLKDFL